jgi:mannose-6-phosphate isomerase-like protein (cupin superfamily)
MSDSATSEKATAHRVVPTGVPEGRLNRPLLSVVEELPREKLTHLGNQLERAAIRTDDSMLVFHWIPPHPDNVPFHAHDFDQTILVLQGSMIFTLGDDEYPTNTGEILQIPANVPHKGFVAGTETAITMDLFAPVRADYLHLVEHQADAFG